MKASLQLTAKEEKSPHSIVALTLGKLLPLWAEKHPTRCYRFGSHWVVRGLGTSRVIDTSTQWPDIAQLEYIIREAIAEMGWSWGKVFTPESMVVLRDSSPRLHCQSIEECGGQPAIALLAAFLKALGVEV